MTNEERHIAVLDSMLESMDVYDSIQPTTERKKAIKVAIKALEQQPCEDAVSRGIKIGDEVYVHGYVDEIRKDIMIIRNEGGYFSGYKSEVVKELPSVTRQTGEWIFVDKAHEHAHCSECDYGDVDLLDGRPHNYCPRCGAKMQESEDKE